MMKMSIIVFMSVFLFGCPQEKPNATNSSDTKLVEKKPTPEKPAIQANEIQKMTNLTYKGTVHFLQMEGGFYGIITDKGEKLLPMNLDKQYLIHGTIIHFSGSFVKDMMTIQQWGTPFKIKQVELISLGDKNINPEF